MSVWLFKSTALVFVQTAALPDLKFDLCRIVIVAVRLVHQMLLRVVK
jgi:hypothetical protein